MIRLTYLDRQHNFLKSQLQRDYKDVLGSNTLILGPEVQSFENLFANYCEAKYAAGVGNGLDAISLSLMALNIGGGNEVLIPSNSFIATALAVSRVNAKPIFVDCNDNYSLNLDLAKKLITKKTKAIIPVHLFGIPENMSQIMSFSKQFKLFVIEDCAQAHGAKYLGKRVGTFGDFGAFSFYPTKNLGAQGDGGIVIANNKKNIDKIKMLRNYGSLNKVDYKCIGINSRLDSLQAKFLSTKLNYLDKWNDQRNKISQLYLNGLKDIKNIALPETSDNKKSVWHLFVIRCKNGRRNELLNFMKENNVMCGIHYPKPIHKTSVYKNRKIQLKKSEKFSEQIISLPMDPFLKKNEVMKVISLIRKFFAY